MSAVRVLKMRTGRLSFELQRAAAQDRGIPRVILPPKAPPARGHLTMTWRDEKGKWDESSIKMKVPWCELTKKKVTTLYMHTLI